GPGVENFIANVVQLRGAIFLSRTRPVPNLPPKQWTPVLPAGQATANGPVLVSEIEASARAAGLLGSAQPITDAKLFKRAKKSLGIRSVHNGFGSAGKWFWLLETQPALLVADPPSEVASLIPSSWIEGVGRLNPQRPPPGVPMHRWRQFLTDCHRFL